MKRSSHVQEITAKLCRRTEEKVFFVELFMKIYSSPEETSTKSSLFYDATIAKENSAPCHKIFVTFVE